MANFTPKSVVKSAVRTLTTPIATLAAFSDGRGRHGHEQPVRLHGVPVGRRDDAGGREDAGGLHGPVRLRGQRGRHGRHDRGQVPDGRGLHRERDDGARRRPRSRRPWARPARTSTDDDSFSATIKCHDANGELYNVSFSRTAVTVSGLRRPTRSSRPSRPGPTRCRRWPEAGLSHLFGSDQCRRDWSGPPVHQQGHPGGVVVPRPLFFQLFPFQCRFPERLSQARMLADLFQDLGRLEDRRVLALELLHPALELDILQHHGLQDLRVRREPVGDLALQGLVPRPGPGP